MDVLMTIEAVVVTISTISILAFFIKRFFEKVLNKEQVLLVRLLLILFGLSLFLAVVSPVVQMHYLFYLLLVLFVTAMGVLVLGTRRILEQYLTGLFVTKVLDLHVGDYIEVGQMRGYITALEEAFVVIKDPRREYVYIPYTTLLQTPFRRVKSPEGHEVRIKLFVPFTLDVKKVRGMVEEVAKEYGLEKMSVDVEKIGARGAVFVVRGVLKDPRQEDELKYSILDRVYAELAK
ncbi:MAG: mechanosensitive ion channel family protein [Pyrobaculum sp.]